MKEIIVRELPVLNQLFKDPLYYLDLFARFLDVYFGCIGMSFFHYFNHSVIKVPKWSYHPVRSLEYAEPY